MNTGMILRPLVPEDAVALADMLSGQPADYMRYFAPFHFDRDTITDMLRKAHRDVYMGIFWNDKLAGFFMLRGWDQGYEIPAYGVTIDHQHRNLGLAKLSLEMSKTISRLNGAQKLMLKVHPDNAAAKHVYEDAGFVQTGIDAKNDNLIYHVEL
jgi:RimJ/RimL family protein N-acetyltransferase